jgi:regulatory protein
MNCYIITAIVHIPRKKQWRMCLFDTGVSIQIPAEFIVLKSLDIGRKLSEQEVEELISEAERIKGKETAFRLLAVQARSESELIQRLRQEGLKQSSVQRVISDLKRLNLINDEAYAYSFIQDFLQRRPSGRLRLKAELYKKGIKEPVAECVLDMVFAETSPIELAQSAAHKWLAKHSKISKKERFSRLVRYLSQQGFNWDVIEEVIGVDDEFARSEK